MYSDQDKKKNKEKDKTDEVQPSPTQQARLRRVYHNTDCFSVDLSRVSKTTKFDDDKNPGAHSSRVIQKFEQRANISKLIKKATESSDDDSEHCSEFSGQDIDKTTSSCSSSVIRKDTPYRLTDCFISSSKTTVLDDKINTEIIDEQKTETKQVDAKELIQTTEISDDDSDHCSEFSGQDIDKQTRNHKLLL